MELKIAKLQFTSPLHLSRGKTTLDESLDVLHSDTLKSALFVCALDLFGGEILRGDEGKNFFEKFTISSAFPFTPNELFFPRPEWLPKSIEKQTEPDATPKIDRKALKSVKYFNQSNFERLLKGELVTLDPNYVKKYYSERNIKSPFQSETVQRVTVNRTYEEEGNTFYTERLYFREGCGLFFLIEFHDDTIRPIVEAALRLLGDNGIGSDKSVGNGQFTFEKLDDFDFDFAQNANKQMALSLYCPNTNGDRDHDFINDKDFLEKSAYSLIKRGGYIANPDNFDRSTLRKKSIIMFKEGSVFPKDRTLIGDIKDLKPEIAQEHPIWRDGRALFFPYIYLDENGLLENEHLTISF